MASERAFPALRPAQLHPRCQPCAKDEPRNRGDWWVAAIRARSRRICGGLVSGPADTPMLSQQGIVERAFMKAVQIEAFGSPAEVAKVVDVPDVGAPAAGEVVITLEASPINQYDPLMIAGGYGYRPQLPAIMGTEGVGRVVAAGAGVKHLKEGDRTLVPFLHPSWAERVKTDAPWLRPLPPGDINQFAMMGVNPPTAYLLLTDIVKLPRGSWVIQNGANSGVGRATVAIAKSLGLRTVNVVRRHEVVAEIKALGGDVVLVDGPLSVAVRAAADAGSRSALLRDDERRHLSGDQPAG